MKPAAFTQKHCALNEISRFHRDVPGLKKLPQGNCKTWSKNWGV
jgi:hypothetical protein